MKKFILMLVMISAIFTVAQQEEILRDKARLDERDILREREIFKAQEFEGEFRKEIRRELKPIFDPRVRTRNLFNDFSPPENQVIKNPTADGNTFFGGATKQNEQEFRDARLKKLSKLDFIERRVIERSFGSFLRKNLEGKMTASRRSKFKRLTAEVKNLRRAKNTRLAKGKNKRKSKVLYAYKNLKESQK